MWLSAAVDDRAGKIEVMPSILIDIINSMQIFPYEMGTDRVGFIVRLIRVPGL